MTTAQHVARHARFIERLERMGLDRRFAAMMRARTEPGFVHHGEEAHHEPDFAPVAEGYPEVSDALDLLGVHAPERVALGIAKPLSTARARRRYSEALAALIVAANAYTALMAELGAFEVGEND